MKKNKLYTVNKGNIGFFKGDRLCQNIFDGELNSTLTRPNVTQRINWADPIQKAAALGTNQGLINGFRDVANTVNPFSQNYLSNFAEKDNAVSNPFSFKEAFSKEGLTNGLNAGAGMAISAGASLLGGLAYNGISDGYDAGGVGQGLSSVGNTVGGAISTVNPLAGAAVTFASNLVGGAINRAFGTKVDEAKKAAVEEGIKQNENFVSNAGTFDAVEGPKAVMTDTDVAKGGWLGGGAKADRINRELKEKMIAARSFANRSVDNNIFNLQDDQLNDALANYAAYGGSLDSGAVGLMQQNRYFDTIDKRTDAIANKNNYGLGAYTGGAKTFADGGLAASFLDDFSTDPIGAAVRYNRGLEQMQAQREAESAEAQRELDYQNMQKRMLALETQNQGLQALMAVQNQPTITEEIPASSSTPSPATPVSSGNNTWDYIEGQLRKSGKFNDVQIQGIKYNLQRESSIDPTAVGDGGAAFGLGQWHGKRQPKDRSLEGQTQHLIDTLSNYDGKEHWIGKENYEGFLNARTPEEAHYWIARGYERPAQRIVDKVKRDSDMSLKRLKAFGGELGTNGTDFTNGLLYIDEGGSHESNPMDGVQLGLDPEGIPNLVEEGETVYNDYVFSDRMMVPKFMYKELGLGGALKKGISFADASKKLAQESEQRPNDPISRAGLNASLSKLAEIQETERMKKNAEDYTGLAEYACGGKMNKYACGGKKGNLFWGWGDQSNQLNYWLPKPKQEFIGLTPAEMQRLAEMQIEANKAQPQAAKTQAATRSTNRSSDHPYGERVVTGNDPYRMGPPSQATAPHSSTPQAGAETQGVGYAGADAGVSNDVVRNNGITETARKAAEDVKDERSQVYDNYKPYDTWMRMVPVWGAGAMTLTDMLGLTNKPDYTYADKIEAAANAAGYAPNISYNPIGDYMRYEPLDRMFQQNNLNAIARAAERTIMNSSMSPTTKYAALLSANYNNQLAAGNLFRQEQEYNRGQYERTKEFNRRTNMFNSQMGLEADMANARYRQQAQQMGLSGLAQAAALRDSIDARVGAARSANLNNFLTSMGNIGRENFALNQINSDPSRQYGAYRSGVSTHKRSAKGKKGSRWT